MRFEQADIGISQIDEIDGESVSDSSQTNLGSSNNITLGQGFSPFGSSKFVSPGKLSSSNTVPNGGRLVSDDDLTNAISPGIKSAQVSDQNLDFSQASNLQPQL